MIHQVQGILEITPPYFANDYRTLGPVPPHLPPVPCETTHEHHWSAGASKGRGRDTAHAPSQGKEDASGPTGQMIGGSAQRTTVSLQRTRLAHPPGPNPEDSIHTINFCAPTDEMRNFLVEESKNISQKERAHSIIHSISTPSTHPHPPCDPPGTLMVLRAL